MKEIFLKESDCIPAEEALALKGTFLDKRHYDRLITTDTKVYKPNGDLLLVFRKKVVPGAVCKVAYPVLRKAAKPAGNRGLASGKEMDVSKMKRQNRPAIPHSPGSRARVQPLKKDGTVSNTDYAPADVASGIIGYYDRVVRFPYCRLTAFNLHHPEKLAKALPFIKAIDAVFKREVPERYAAQLEIVRQTSPDFVIHGTAFSTVTVNKDWRTAAHTDKGDFRQGFGVMSALRSGSFDGYHLIFPRFRVAVDMDTGDVLLADVHELHGNSPLNGIRALSERISVVCYYRRQMVHCGSAEQEGDRARRRRRGDPMTDRDGNAETDAHLNDEVDE